MTLIKLIPLNNRNNKNTFRVKFNTIKYKNKIIEDCYNLRFIIGEDIIKKVTWLKTDIIEVYQDDQKNNIYFIKKSSDKIGYKLTAHNNSYYLQFRTKDIINQYNKLTVVKYELIDQGIKIIL